MKGKPTGSHDALLRVHALGSLPPKPPDSLVSKPSSPLPSNQVATAAAPPSAIPDQLLASVASAEGFRNRASSVKRKAGKQATAATAKVI